MRKKRRRSLNQPLNRRCLLWQAHAVIVMISASLMSRCSVVVWLKHQIWKLKFVWPRTLIFFTKRSNHPPQIKDEPFENQNTTSGKKKTTAYLFSAFRAVLSLTDINFPLKTSRPQFLSSHLLMTLPSNFPSPDWQPSWMDLNRWEDLTTDSRWVFERPTGRKPLEEEHWFWSKADRFQLPVGQWQRWTWRAPVDSKSTSWLIEIP